MGSGDLLVAEADGSDASFRFRAPVVTLIDTPGVQAFGVHHLGVSDLAAAFIEFRSLLGQCRFRDCRHLAEPGCAITAAEATNGVEEFLAMSGQIRAADVGKLDVFEMIPDALIEVEA